MNTLHHPGSPKAPSGSPGISRRCGSRSQRPSSPRTAPPAPRAFTLTELLIVIAIILALTTMLGSAVSNVRTTQKANATRDLIAKLDDIISTRFQTYDSRAVDVASLSLPSNPNPPPSIFKYVSEKRAWHIRRNVLSGDLPDRWTDVAFMANSVATNKWIQQSPLQRTAIGIWNDLPAVRKDPSNPLYVGNTYAGAECLFMLVMQSGAADCIDCRNLSPIGDKDQDGAQEFWDAWGNPIGYILWPAALQLPSGSGVDFFSGSRVLKSVFLEDANGNGVLDSGEKDYNKNGVLDVPSATLGMRPLIYSAGPDGEYGLERNNESSNLAPTGDNYGVSCGDWSISPTNVSAARTSSFADDNITNFDAEAKQ